MLFRSEANDEAFARQLASYADIYVNDAFGTAHRAHASTAGVAADLPAYAGFLMEAELAALTRLTEHPVEPFVCAIGALPAARYRGFTLLVADRTQAFALSSDGTAARVDALAPGHHMLTPEGCDVDDAPRVRAYRDDLRAAPPPAPETGDWASWTALLRREDAEDPHHAMTVTTESGFGTVASTLIGIPAARGAAPALLVAPGPPTRVGYVPLATKTRPT